MGCRNTWALLLALGATVQLFISQPIISRQTLCYAPHASQVPTGAWPTQSPQLPGPHSSWRKMHPPGEPQEVEGAESRDVFAAEEFHAASAGEQLLQVHACERFRTGDRFTCRTISQFSFFGAISAYNAPKYADHLMVGNECPSSTTARSYIEFLHAVCAPHGLLPRDVCWFINFPHSLPSYGSISMTETGRSPECLLSYKLSWWLNPMENMMLIQQHEMLRAALDPTWQAPEHSYKMPRNLRRVPQLPHADLLAKLFLRCGVNERHPLDAVVTEVCSTCCWNTGTHYPQG